MENIDLAVDLAPAPCGHSEYLIPADELGELAALADHLEERTAQERTHFEHIAGGVLERLAREIASAAIGSFTARLVDLDMQLMAAAHDFKQEACRLIEATLIEELGEQRRDDTRALRAKIEQTVQQLSWPGPIQIAANPEQTAELRDTLPERFVVTKNPELPTGNFRLTLGRTAISYDLSADLKAIATKFRSQLLHGQTN